MEIQNSIVSFYETLVCELYYDIAECYKVPRREQKAEIGLIRSRILKEGISFLTKTLPRLGKTVDTALSTGTRLKIEGLTLNSALPRFLGWLLSRVFDTHGMELERSDPVALSHFRQFVGFLYKLEIDYDEETENSVIQSFVDTDKELALCVLDADDPTVTKARAIVARVMGTVDPTRIKPRHGPGSVATGEDTLQKSVFSRLYVQLEKEYPFTEYFQYNLTHTADTVSEIQALEVLDTATAKVVLVPKDSRGPRLISSEPLEIQWIQQGLGVEVQAAIERSTLTGRFVNFTDQTVNQRLALLGSSTHEWVTLDMKEASDRVSLALVRALFSDHPALLRCLEATRSSRTRLPNGTIIELNKFAPMGSRLCFPVEALVFYALIVGALQVHLGYSLRKAHRRVYVYGDDIIMRREDYAVALQQLPRFGLLFNPRKCCTHGSFRESCGCEAYKGFNITPVRLRTVWCHHRRTPEVLTSYTALHNALYGRYYFRAAAYVRSELETIYGFIPWTDRIEYAPNGAALSLAGGPAYTACLAPAAVLNQGRIKTGFSPDHNRSVRSWVVRPVKVKQTLDGWSELLRRHSDGFGASGGVYALPRRNRLKRGWMAI
jgi:hypothetical protein